VNLQLELLQKRLDERHIKVELTDLAREFVAREGYDPVYGARPLKRFIKRQVETPLARQLLAGDLVEGSSVMGDYVDGQIVFRQREPEEVKA